MLMKQFPARSVDLSPNRKFGAGVFRRGGSSSGSGGGGGTGLAGSGSPEGAQTAEPGTTYYQTNTSRLWIKATGSGNTGWESTPKSTTGTGDPNGAVVGRPGDQFYSTDLQNRYVKETGADTNTGWI